MYENISLVGLVCPSCDKKGTQVITDYVDYHVGKKRRVRVDTECSCGEVHYYTPLLAVGAPVVIRQDDLLVLPF